MNSLFADKYIYGFFSQFPKEQWEEILHTLVSISLQTVSKKSQNKQKITMDELIQINQIISKEQHMQDQLQSINEKLSDLDKNMQKILKHKQRKHRKEDSEHIVQSHENICKKPRYRASSMNFTKFHSKKQCTSTTINNSTSRSILKNTKEAPCTRACSPENKTSIEGSQSNFIFYYLEQRQHDQKENILKEIQQQKSKDVIEIATEFLNNSIIKSFGQVQDAKKINHNPKDLNIKYIEKPVMQNSGFFTSRVQSCCQNRGPTLSKKSEHPLMRCSITKQYNIQ